MTRWWIVVSIKKIRNRQAYSNRDQTLLVMLTP